MVGEGTRPAKSTRVESQQVQRSNKRVCTVQDAKNTTEIYEHLCVHSQQSSKQTGALILVVLRVVDVNVASLANALARRATGN